MGRRDTTSAVIDGLLKMVAAGGLVMTTIIAPNAMQTLDKPLRHFFNKMDRRSREREYRRLLLYMRQQGLITFRTEDYEHGIQITKTGKKRIETLNLDLLVIPHPVKWDRIWRLVFFDIPETKKQLRNQFTMRLKKLGFRQLQQSVWVYPFSCRKEVEIITYRLGVSNYVTYIETGHIDFGEKLKNRFPFKF